MPRKLSLLLLALTLLAACTLERNNPLDPRNNSEIEVPQIVTGIELKSSGVGSASKWVDVVWDVNANAEGYYLYRALSYNGSYQNIAPAGIPNAEAPLYHDVDVYSDHFYYYKLSAYNEFGLEGPISSPVGIRVP
ncbi:MAG: hypothetical protein K8R90_07510 [Candidatus Cloacimonetes bacterium]|nr:hypothetical protein [Candidatus Cloacimonadota bacterium]